MTKIFRVYFYNEEMDENYWHELPTLEEAMQRANDLELEGYMRVRVEEIRI